VTGQTAIAANAIGNFTGLYRYLRIVKTAGSGTQTQVIFGSIAP
jgi:hypothetical protein